EHGQILHEIIGVVEMCFVAAGSKNWRDSSRFIAGDSRSRIEPINARVGHPISAFAENGRAGLFRFDWVSLEYLFGYSDGFSEALKSQIVRSGYFFNNLGTFLIEAATAVPRSQNRRRPIPSQEKLDQTFAIEVRFQYEVSAIPEPARVFVFLCSQAQYRKRLQISCEGLERTAGQL